MPTLNMSAFGGKAGHLLVRSLMSANDPKRTSFTATIWAQHQGKPRYNLATATI